MPAKGWKGRYDIKKKVFLPIAAFIVDLAERRVEKQGDSSPEVPRHDADQKVQRRVERLLYRPKGVSLLAEELAVKIAKLPDRVATIIGKSGAELGDAALLADDTALMKIRDLLLEINPKIVEQNKNKRLAK